MPNLDSRLDTLAGPPESFPPALMAALRSTRRRRRVAIGALSTSGVIALALVASLLSPAPPGSAPSPFSAQGVLAGHSAAPGRFTLVSLTRHNRDADLDNLSLPDTDSGMADPFHPGPADARLLGYR
jgi:hypothetical protein